MQLCIIAAMSENRVIGRAGQLPWHLSADLKRFRALTSGHAILMGRKTFESIGRPLPDRRSIVLTRQADFGPAGVEVAHSFEDALLLAAGEQKLFVIGGASIYEIALRRADRLFFTVVHACMEGDVYFPAFVCKDWQLLEDVRHEPDAKTSLPYSFRTFKRLGL